MELVDGWWNLQTGLKDGLLSLQTNVLGPLDESAQIALGLDILPDAKVSDALLEQGVDHAFHFGFLGGQRCGRHFLALLLALRRETRCEAREKADRENERLTFFWTMLNG